MNATTTARNAARDLLIGYLVATTPTLAAAQAITYVPATNTRDSEYHVTIGLLVFVFTHNVYQNVMPVYVRTMKVVHVSLNALAG